MTGPSAARWHKSDLTLVIKKVTEIHIGCINDFRKLVNSASREEQRRIAQFTKGLSEEDVEFFSDETYKIDKIRDLSEQLSIIALYRAVENSIKTMRSWCCGPISLKKVSQMKVEAIDKHFESKHQIALKQVKGNSAVQNLKRLNNAIKHDAWVRKGIARDFPHLKEGETWGTNLLALAGYYDPLAKIVPEFVLTLARKLKIQY